MSSLIYFIFIAETKVKYKWFQTMFFMYVPWKFVGDMYSSTTSITQSSQNIQTVASFASAFNSISVFIQKWLR